jgi:hypothetical protein
MGLTQSPDHHVPVAGTQQLNGQLTSAHMTKPAGWTISMPSGEVEGVIYCLRGHGNDHRMAFDDVHLPDVAARLIVSRGGRPEPCALDQSWRDSRDRIRWGCRLPPQRRVCGRRSAGKPHRADRLRHG